MPTWIGVPHQPFEADCKPPYSFYFDLKPLVWTSSASNSYPLHRLFTLARKQGATVIASECALAREDVIKELDDLDAFCGSGGTAQATTLAFFAKAAVPIEIEAQGEDTLIGSLTIINYTPEPNSIQQPESYIYEAFFGRPKRLGHSGESSLLLNNHIFANAEFWVKFRGREFNLRGVYYCQQNGTTHRCAQSSLRTALRTLYPSAADLTAADINTSSKSSKPSEGLTDQEMENVVDSYCPTLKAFTIDCRGMPTEDYISNISCFVESGIMSLISFTTMGGGVYAQHVVTCYGFTQNTDEWHPQALLAYSGPKSSPFYPSSAWTDHLLIHDDNFGPYLTLDSRALEADPDVSPLVIMAILPSGFSNTPVGVQGIATSFLHKLLGALPAVDNPWLDHLKEGNVPVLRVTIIDKIAYSENIAETAHDGTQLSNTQSDPLVSSLPDTFYMVEISVPPLYTGNHSKIGEILVDAFAYDSANPFLSVLGARMPGFVVVTAGGGNFDAKGISSKSHSPLFRLGDHADRW